jgi:hypothetical protein
MVEILPILVRKTIACRGSRIPEIIRQKEEGLKIWKNDHLFL